MSTRSSLWPWPFCLPTAAWLRGGRRKNGVDISGRALPCHLAAGHGSEAARSAESVSAGVSTHRCASTHREAARSADSVLAGAYAASELRPGPHDYATAMDDWAPEQRRALAEEVPGSMVHLQEVIGRGIDVTTHYSGTGVAEMACAAITPGQVKFHGACDFNPTCRKVLVHHGAESAAEHVTTDLCDRPPPHILEESRAADTPRQAQRPFSCFHGRRAASASTPGPAES